MAILLSALALVELTAQADATPVRRISLSMPAQIFNLGRLELDDISGDLNLNAQTCDEVSSREVYRWRSISLGGGRAFDLAPYPIGDQILIGPTTSVVGRVGLDF